MSTKGIQHSWRIKRNMHQSHCETQHTCRDGCNNQETNTQNVDIGIVVHRWQGCKRAQTLWKTFCQFVKWLIRELPYDSATPKCESERNENRCSDNNLHTNNQQCRWQLQPETTQSPTTGQCVWFSQWNSSLGRFVSVIYLAGVLAWF